MPSCVAICALRAALLAALALPLAGGALAQEAAPGTPKPSRGAPGDMPGKSDAFGTQGGRSLESGTPAEREAGREAATVERIEITGNERTPEGVIRDHLAVAPGKVLTPEDVLTSRVRLAQLGIFTRVDVETERGSAPGRAIVQVRVVEKTLLTVTDLTVAHTAVSPLYGSLGVGYSGVPWVGVAASLTAAFDGRGRRAARFTLYDPEVRGSSIVAGARFVWHDGLESACATPNCGGDLSRIPWLRYRRIGGEVDVGWRPAVFSRLLLGYRFEALSATTDAGADAAARPALHEGGSHLTALTFDFDIDSRDDAFLPTGGSRLQLQATVATAALGGDYEYSRYLVQGERWFDRGGGRAFRLDGAVGLVQGDAPFFDRFYAADWSYFSIGLASPRLLDLNFSPDSRYDVLLAVVGGEHDWSLWDRPARWLRRGVVALGARVVYTARVANAGRSALSATPVTVDAALRMDTKLGVVSIGLGYAADQILKAVPLHVPGIQHR